MLFSDLALILTIMINTLLLHQTSEAGILPVKEQPNFHSHGVRKSFNNLDVNEKTQRFPGKNGRTNKAIKMRQKKWYLNPVMLKLAIAIDKYERRGLIKSIYSGVSECGLENCEKFQGLIPDDQLIGHVKCFRDNFKKMVNTHKKIIQSYPQTISEELLKFQKGVRIIEKTFRDLIDFEDESPFNNRSRLTILKELKTEMEMLNLEIETVMRNKRLNFSRQPETLTSSSIPHPNNETHLIINEWRIIQVSKRFLQDWQKNFKKIFKCWKKRRQKKEKKKKTLKPRIGIKPDYQPPPPTPKQIHTNFPKFEKEETRERQFSQQIVFFGTTLSPLFPFIQNNI